MIDIACSDDCAMLVAVRIGSSEIGSTMNDKEQYYDEHIAPKLLEISKECGDHGLSFIAVCEYKPGEYGRTLYQQKDASLAFRLIDSMARAKANVDKFMFGVMKHARENGHSSVILTQLGIPEIPSDE